MRNYLFLSSALVLITLAGPNSEASAADQRLMQGPDYGAPRLNPTVAATLESSLADLAQSLTKLTHTFATALQGVPSASPGDEASSAKSGAWASTPIPVSTIMFFGSNIAGLNPGDFVQNTRNNYGVLDKQGRLFVVDAHAGFPYPGDRRGQQFDRNAPGTISPLQDGRWGIVGRLSNSSPYMESYVYPIISY